MKETERQILRAAEVLFADRGFEITWADIAAATDLTPGVLRRYFRTKSLLVDKVVARLLARRWRPEWDTLLGNRAAPLERRLIRFFTEYQTQGNRNSTRLWTRAGLAGLHSAGRYSYHAFLVARVIGPMLRELRHEQDLPSPEQRPLLSAEVELGYLLYGSLAFPNTRMHVFDLPVYGSAAEIAALMVRTWLPGARAEISRLHALAVDQELAPLPDTARAPERAFESQAPELVAA